MPLITNLNRSSQDSAAFPFFLPDGRHFLYVLGSPAHDAIYLGSLDAQAGEAKLQAASVEPRPHAHNFADRWLRGV